MRSIDPAVAAHRAARSFTNAHALLWLLPRDRATGARVGFGLWTGDDHAYFTIGGTSRLYFGGGVILSVPDIESAIGLEVMHYQVELSGVAPEVEQLVRGYDARFAAVQIHRAEFDQAGTLLAPPERRLKGEVNGAPIRTPARGGIATVTLEVVSNARVLTRHGHGTKSDETQRRRGGDRFRRFSSVTGKVPVFWGTERVGETNR